MDQIEELIKQLDPNRDYGERTYDEVVAGVRAGDIKINKGKTVPLLSYGGRFIKGSGKSIVDPPVPVDELNLIRQQKRSAAGRAWFDSRLMGEGAGDGPLMDRDLIYNKSIEAIREGRRGWEKLAEFFLMQHVGKPRETASDTGIKLIEVMMEKLGQDTQGTVRMAEIPANADD